MLNSEDPPITKYSGLSQYYFRSIHKRIIKYILQINKSKVLDYGCGYKVFDAMIKRSFAKRKLIVSCLNYDLNSELSDYDSISNLEYEVFVSTHVLQYLSTREIKDLLNGIKTKNKNCTFIFGLSRQNLLSKVLAFLSFNFNAHDATITTYDKQVEVINKKLKIIKASNILFMTDVFVCEFR